MNTREEFDEAFEQWMRNHRYTGETQTIMKINVRVRENVQKLGGLVAASSYERAYLELVTEKAIKPFRGTVTEVAAAETPAGIPQDVVDFIERGSAFEQRRRYANDPAFKRYYDLYANQQLRAKVAAEQSDETLTVEAYTAMPAIEVAKKYRSSASFRRGVDQLIKDGKI